MNRKSKFIFITVLWIIYHTLICTNGFCKYWIEEYNNGWYLMENLDIGEGYSEPTIFDGPFAEKEAIYYLNELIIKSQRFKKKYGTIYNFIPELERNNYGKLIIGENIIFKKFTFYITILLFMIGPIFIFYKIIYKY